MSPLPSQIRSLTGLRGYAALWVVVSHLSYTDALFGPVGARMGWKLLDGLIRHEYLAVDLFFMLSGFVLTHVHSRDFAEQATRPTVIRFLLLRLARIYPLHLLALLMTALAVYFVPAAGVNTVISFILNLLLMASWGYVGGNSWNLPAWSLNSEWLAYLAFPLVALATGATKRARWQLLGLAAMLGLFWLLFFAGPSLPNYTDGNGANARVLIGVCVGSLLRRLFDQPAVRKLPWGVLLILSLPLIAATMTGLDGHRLNDNVWAYLAMAFVLFAAANLKANVWPLTHRLPVYVGEISYAIYILHYPVLRTLRWLFDGALHRAAENETTSQLVIAGAIGLVVLASALAHHLVEIPARNWARRRIDSSLPVVRAAEPDRALSAAVAPATNG